MLITPCFVLFHLFTIRFCNALGGRSDLERNRDLEKSAGESEEAYAFTEISQSDEDWVDPGDMFASRRVKSRSHSIIGSELSFDDEKVNQVGDHTTLLTEGAGVHSHNSENSTCFGYVKRFTLMLLNYIDVAGGTDYESDVYEFNLNVKLSKQDLAVMKNTLNSNGERIYELDEVIQKIFSRGPDSYKSSIHWLFDIVPSFDLWSIFNMAIIFFALTMVWSVLSIQLFGISSRRIYMLVFNLFVFGFAWNAKYVYVKKLMEKSAEIESCRNKWLMWIFSEDECITNLMSDPLLETKPLVVFAESLGDLFHLFGVFGKHFGKFYFSLSKELTYIQGLLVPPFMALVGLICFYIFMSNRSKFTFRSIEETRGGHCSCPAVTSTSFISNCSETPDLPKPKLNQLVRSNSDGSLRKRAIEYKQKSCFTLNAAHS